MNAAHQRTVSQRTDNKQVGSHKVVSKQAVVKFVVAIFLLADLAWIIFELSPSLRSSVSPPVADVGRRWIIRLNPLGWTVNDWSVAFALFVAIMLAIRFVPDIVNGLKSELSKPPRRSKLKMTERKRSNRESISSTDRMMMDYQRSRRRR